MKPTLVRALQDKAQLLFTPEEVLSRLPEAPGLRAVLQEDESITLEIPRNCFLMPEIRSVLAAYEIPEPSLASVHPAQRASEWTPLRPLYPHQEEAVEFLVARGGGLLCDSMGLGKTSAAICAAEKYATMYARHPKAPRVVIGPKYLREVWRRELLTLGCVKENEICVLEGRDVQRKDVLNKMAVWFFVHYDVLSAWWPELSALRPVAVIIDEAHLCKNTRSARYAAVEKTTTGTLFRLALTGTPILNRVQELWAILNLVGGGYAWGTGKDFLVRYAGAYFDGYGWVPGRPTHTDELHARLSTTYIRRTIDDIDLELPPITREPVDLSLTKAQLDKHRELLHGYEMEDVMEHMRNGTLGSEVLKWITACRKHLSNVKLPMTIEEVGSALEQGEAVVVFAWLKSSVAKIIGAFAKDHPTFSITGDTPMRAREAHIDEFQKTGGLLVATYGALSVGVTLTKARVVILHDLDWVPANMLQAEARVYRIGQNRAVLSKWMIATNTFDSFVAKKLLSKASLIQEVLKDDSGAHVEDVLNDFQATSDQLDVAGFLDAWRDL